MCDVQEQLLTVNGISSLQQHAFKNCNEFHVNNAITATSHGLKSEFREKYKNFAKILLNRHYQGVIM